MSAGFLQTVAEASGSMVIDIGGEYNTEDRYQLSLNWLSFTSEIDIDVGVTLFLMKPLRRYGSSSIRQY